MADQVESEKKPDCQCKNSSAKNTGPMFLRFLEESMLSEGDKIHAKMQFLSAHVSAAAELNQALITNSSSPLSVQFNSEVLSALQTVEALFREQEEPKPKCETKIKILKPENGSRIEEGTKTIDVEVEYTAELDNGEGLTDCVVNVIVEKIDNARGKVVDRKLTPKDVDSPAKGKKVTITANSDMDLKLGNGVRITATLVCNECPATSDGPKLLSTVKKP
jgi:hypothetical protein